MLITLTGPSLTGKSTLAKDLENYNFAEMISFTTRLPRTGEINGVNYWFTTEEKIKHLAKQDELMELIEKEGNFYGIAKSELDRVMSLGKIGVLVVAPDGLTQIENYCQNHNVKLFSIFINNDESLLIKRFLKRFKEDLTAFDSEEITEKKYDTYTKRLMSFQHEYATWALPALNKERHYDLVVPSFDSHNSQSVINQIIEATTPKKSFKMK